MAEYIEREALLNAFENADADVCEDYGDTCDWGYGIKLVKEIVRSVSAADVAPVVLCKDCRYAVVAWGDVYACTKPHHLVSGDHFCAFGARMDGGAVDEP